MKEPPTALLFADRPSIAPSRGLKNRRFFATLEPLLLSSLMLAIYQDDLVLVSPSGSGSRSLDFLNCVSKW